MVNQLSSERIKVDNQEEALELYFERGWTDGLPVVPATENKIMAFLDYLNLEPDRVPAPAPARCSGALPAIGSADGA